MLTSNPQIARVNLSKDTASGKREGWFKQVIGLDRGQKGGYALEGKFLNDGEHDLPVGTVVVEMSPGGSVKNPVKRYYIRVVDAQGGLPFLREGDKLYMREQISPSYLDLVQEALGYNRETLDSLATARLERETAKRVKEAAEREALVARKAAERETKRVHLAECARMLLVKLNPEKLGDVTTSREMRDIAEEILTEGVQVYNHPLYIFSQDLLLPDEMVRANVEEFCARGRGLLRDALAVLDPNAGSDPLAARLDTLLSERGKLLARLAELDREIKTIR